MQVTLARRLRKMRRERVSGWKWSSCLMRSVGSCCCPADGLWSAVSLGPHGSAGWHETTSDCLKRWQGCILWLSLCLWLLVSINLLSPSTHLAVDVHNTL